MASLNFQKSKKIYAYLALILLIIVLIATTVWFIKLDSEVTVRLQNKRILTPTTYYSAPSIYFTQMRLPITELKSQLIQLKMRERTAEEKLFAGDFKILDLPACSAELSIELPPETSTCVVWQNHKDEFYQAMILDPEFTIVKTFKGLPWVESEDSELEAQLLAQYADKEPIFQSEFSLGQIPPHCLNAILSVEDKQFLSHMGVNPKGIMRALFVNLTTGRASQGGSTITQQTVKNYFLTSEKTLKRKVKEFAMSLILEARATKDDILETYLNIIYMGQSGPFQIRGYGAASEYYFSKNLSDLNLSECSLLAAIVNSPGLYNPYKKPENATKRQKLVLQLMQDQNYISETEKIEAEQQKLPTLNSINLSETAPYFIDAVRKQAQQEGIDVNEKNIYTTLDLKAQSAAQKAVQSHLQNLETKNTLIKNNKDKKLSLEALFLSVQPKKGWITSAVGGRNFKMTQYNRVTDSHRQVGSIMKPLVYLAALGEVSPQGEVYNPNTILKDEKFTYSYEGQKWTPSNYDKKFNGDVPMHIALKNSLNVATSRLALDIGLDKILDLAQKIGIQSNLKKVPSLSLGAFELYPLEVLEIYTTLSQLGRAEKLSFIREVQDPNGNSIWKYEPQPKQILEADKVAELVGMLKQTNISGTAMYVSKSGFTHPSAGKTGTTSDYKDSWYAGMTPYQVAISWVGYDNNTPHKLTGASGALPIWIEFMKNYSSQFPANDFAWPENTLKEVNSDGVELIFKKD